MGTVSFCAADSEHCWTLLIFQPRGLSECAIHLLRQDVGSLSMALDTLCAQAALSLQITPTVGTSPMLEFATRYRAGCSASKFLLSEMLCHLKKDHESSNDGAAWRSLHASGNQYRLEDCPSVCCIPMLPTHAWSRAYTGNYAEALAANPADAPILYGL